MFRVLTVFSLFFCGLLLSTSCISQGHNNKEIIKERNLLQEGEKLLSKAQLENLSYVSKITLFDFVPSEYEGIPKSKKNRELTQNEVENLLSILKKASKDTTINIDNPKTDAYQLVIEGKEDFLTLVIDTDFDQLKIGDVKQGVTISGASQDFIEAVKKIIANEQ